MIALEQYRNFLTCVYSDDESDYEDVIQGCQLTLKTRRTYAVRPTHTPKDVRRTFLDIGLPRVLLWT